MKEFRAKNPKQLDLCLKLLYAEHMGFSVSVSENIKKKIEYVITVSYTHLTLPTTPYV